MTGRWQRPFRIAGSVLAKVYVEPVRTDRLRAVGWPPGLLIIAVIANAGYLVAVVLAVGAPWLRRWIPLVGSRDVVGMPEMVPWLTVALLTLAAVLAQTGALHAPIPLRIVVLLASLTIMTRLGPSLDSVEQLLLSCGPWLALVIFQIVRWRSSYRWWEYVVVTACYAVALMGAAGASARGSAYGTGGSVDAISLAMETVTLMAGPLALLAGYAIAQWAFGLVRWTAEFGFDAGRRTVPTWALFVVLVGLTAWRLIAEWHNFAVLAFTPRLIIFPLIMIVGGVVCWIVLDKIADRRNPDSTRLEHLTEDLRWVALPAAFGVLAGTVFWALVVVPLDFLAQLAPAVRPADQIAKTVSDVLSGDVVGIAWASLLIIWGGWLAWRGMRGRAELAAVIGLAFLLTRTGRLSIAGGGFGLMLITTIAVLLLVLLVSRRLNRRRIEGMIVVVALALVISEREFFADPVNSVIGGSAALFFGLVWQFLTSGGEANGDSPRWPRSSRVLMVLGFNLLAMAVLGFARVTYRTGLTLDDLQDTGDKLLGGSLILGAAIAAALGVLRGDAPVLVPEYRHDGDGRLSPQAGTTEASVPQGQQADEPRT